MVYRWFVWLSVRLARLQGRLSAEAQEEAEGLVLEALARGGRADEVWRQLDTPDKRAKAGPASVHALLIAMQVGRQGKAAMDGRQACMTGSSSSSSG